MHSLIWSVLLSFCTLTYTIHSANDVQENEFGVLRSKSRSPSDDLLMVMLETFGVSQAELSEDGRTLVAWP